ncbi:lipopolysaccharide biosynthesis protein, partial [uncultured Muribaculum sp.]
MDESLKHTTFKGIIWSSIERFSVQGVSFIVMIIMARILTPKDYGLVGMLTIFIAIAQSLVDSGFSQALIRKLDRNECDFCTVFYFNIVLSILLYIILFISAPLIAKFYNEPILTSLTRVISFGIIINAFSVVHRAKFNIKLDFKTQTKASLSSSLISGVLGIYCAFNGFGVWAIVILQIINQIINVGLLWVLLKWKPKLIFNLESFKNLFNFGSKIAVGGILSTIYDNLYLIVIGKVYNPTDVGLYSRAYQFSTLPSTNISMIIQRVSYPTLCRLQSNIGELRRVYNSYYKALALIIFPLMGLMITIAPNIVEIILGSKWANVIYPLQILCLALAFYPSQGLQINLLNALGKSNIYLKIDIYKKIIGLLCLIISLPFGLIWLCWGQVIATQFALFIHMFYTKKYLDITILAQIAMLLPAIFSTVIACSTIYIYNNFTQSGIEQLLIDILICVLFYSISSCILNFKEINHLFNL